MTQKHISHPEGLPACRAGHSARHIHDQRCASAGGGHFIECCCTATRRYAEPAQAIADWRRINRPARAPRSTAEPDKTTNVLQMHLAASTGAQRTAGGQHGRG